ncbi:MAG: tyrosine-type recombinase/integrase [Bacteroidales bacterium]|nr:tyrosine-type recombinase/integrase [Bacteroidales bacterium]
MREPTKADVIDFKAYMNEKFSDNTKALYITAIRKFFKYLDDTGIYINITTGLRYPKKYKGHRKQPLNDTDVEKLIAAIDTTDLKGKRDFAIINLMLLTGLRSVEVRRIQIKDIEFRNNQTVVYIQGKGYTDKFIYIPLIDEAYFPIEDYLNAFSETYDIEKDNFLFVSHSNNNRNQQLSANGLSKIITGYYQKANIKDKRITAHSLRHTAAMKIH